MKRKLAELIVRRRAALLALTLICAVLAVPCISRTNINYDLNRYLSDDTMTKRALLVMNEEFGAAEQLRLMFSDLDEEGAEEVKAALSQLEEVRLVSHDPAEDTRQAEGKTWSLFTLTLNECDTAKLVTALREMFPERGEYHVGGSAAAQLDVQRSVAEEMPGVMLIAVAVVLIVLLLTSHAWLEPLIILLTLGISILINMGTHFIFPDVSFITFAVSAILQLALSIDYAIMLLHTWNARRDEGLEASVAMVEAIESCFMRVTSSALTTVAGLLSLLFMSFTIGFDIGLALSKGILISMACVFLLMPALTLLMEKPLRRTRHRPLRLGGEGLAAFISRRRKPIAILLTAVVLAGLLCNSQVTYIFTDPGASTGSETAAVNRVFGASTPLALLVPGGDTDEDYERQRELVRRLEALPGYRDGEAPVRGVTAMVTDGAAALQYLSAADVAEVTGISETVVRLFFLTQGFGETVRADRLLDAAGALAAGNASVAALKTALDTARSVFNGPRYARLLVDISFTPQSPVFSDQMEQILSAAREVYGEEFYITGVPMSAYDIGQAFRGDLLKVNLITLLTILLIVALSFRSLRAGGLLVFVIEGAIWITMGLSVPLGQRVFFISYLICLSIQMGATIDYGILLCDQYRTQRRADLSADEALARALPAALPTVLTSGVILVTAGYIIGRMCSIYYISSIGLLISRGALISVLLVLTLLPACLGLTEGKGKRKK